MAGRGIQDVPLRIPGEWDPVWFAAFVRDVLAKADIRNAIQGSGIEISGQSNDHATISSSDDLLQLKDQGYVLADPPTDPLLIPNSRQLAGEPGVVVVTDDGPGGNITMSIQAHSLSYSKLRLGAPLSVIGNPDTASAELIGITGVDDTVLRRTAGALNFGTLTLAMANNHLWTYAKIQAVTATDRLLGRDTAGAGDIEELAVSNGLEFTGAPGIGIANDGVTYARIQNVSAASVLLGRGSAGGAGDVQEIALGTGLSMSGTTLNSSGGSGGNVDGDTHPSSPNVADDEFEVGSTIDTAGSRAAGATAWTALNLSTGTSSVKQGAFVFLPALTVTSTTGGYTQPVTGVWSYTAKITISRGNTNSLAGLAVMASSGGKLIIIGISNNTSLVLQKRNTTTSFNSNVILAANSIAAHAGGGNAPAYFQVTYDGTTLVFSLSSTGIAGTFTPIFSEASATFLGAPTLIALVGENGSATVQSVMAVDWFRKP